MTDDDIIISDPEGEYHPIVERLGGQVIKLSPISSQYLNPMDINPDYADEEDPLTLKSDFILSLCELIVGGRDGLAPVEKTIIDRCVRLVYRDYLSDPCPENMPILEDLYNLLRNQDEAEAQHLATALEIYVTGSLNIFNNRTNTDINNRIVCFDLKELGKGLKKIAMLILQDAVWNKVTVNRAAKRSTWFYIDEMHLLLKEEQTAAYNVGEGDTILIAQGDYAMLVDGGSAPMGTTVFTYLRDNGIEKLEYMVATHPFADHIGGLPDVLRRMNVKNILLPMIYHDTPTYNAFLTAVENSGAEVAVPLAGDTFALGNAEVTVLSPNSNDEWENKANYSVVMRIKFGATSFMLTGDAMREVEANLLNGTANLSSDVLKVSRHGASSATTSGFLDAVNPSIAVISAGEDNSFLSQEVLRRLNNAGVHVFRTDLNGSIVITSDGTVLGVVVER
jgi:beta-lactamase superfamily II metal-dependent hydrolase